MKKIKKLSLVVLIIILTPMMVYKIADMSFKGNHLKLKTNNKILPELFPIVEELITTIESPDKKYKLNLYLNRGNATVDFSVRGEIENKLGMKKNIYYQYHTNKGKASFIENDVVQINGEILNIHEDSFKSLKYISNNRE